MTALNSYLSPPPSTPDLPFGEVTQIVNNRTIDLAQFTSNQRLSQLSDQFHDWMADGANENAIRAAIGMNSSLKDIEVNYSVHVASGLLDRSPHE